MDAVALAARELADFLLLVGALEIEPAHIGARRHFAFAERHHLGAFGDLLRDGLLLFERVAGLIDIAELDRVAHTNGAIIGGLLPHDHAEQRGLAAVSYTHLRAHETVL